MSFQKYLSEFSEYLQIHQYSERTIVSYTANVKHFVSFLEKYYPRITSFEQVSKDIAFDYQAYLAKCTNGDHEIISNTTQRLKLTSLKKMFSILMKKDYILFDPTAALDMPREEQRLTRDVLTETEIQELLKSIPNHTPVGIRNRAIIELFYGCGIRTSELCNLKIFDVNLKEQTVRIVKGKGNKDRIVPIGQYASHYIQVYLDKARKYMLRGKPHDQGYLFLSLRGNPFNKCTINKTVMQSVTKNLKLEKHISAYTFRHYAESRIMPNGKNKVLQDDELAFSHSA